MYGRKKHMTDLLIFAAVAVAAYFIAGFNPAIFFSKTVYHADIRTEGSGNPGFTNFKRVYGGALSWVVCFLDIVKGAAALLPGGFLFSYLYGAWQFGVAYAGMFAMLGHAYPAVYGFRGGKGFLVCLTTAWFLDWRAGTAATLMLMLVLFTLKYMSLSSILAVTAGLAVLCFTGAPLPVCLMYAACVVFMTVRHKANIRRLFLGTESKFALGHKKA